MAAFTLQSLEPWADRGFTRQSHFSILPIILDLVLMLMIFRLVTIQIYSFNAFKQCLIKNLGKGSKKNVKKYGLLPNRGACFTKVYKFAGITPACR